MKIKLTSVMVDNQEKALRFYTDVLGFIKKRDIPMGEARWLTVVSPEGPDDVELLLEPVGEIGKTFQKSLFESGIPLTAFAVDNVQGEYERLKTGGVAFKQTPTKIPDGPTMAVFGDTCGNLIQIYQV
jgi:catechol 2,3-dioxygenase-like lactoylglutathione lyase family enzyme